MRGTGGGGRGRLPAAICPVLLYSPEPVDIVWKGNIIALSKLSPIQHRLMPFAQCDPVRRRLATIQLTPTPAALHLKLWPASLLHLAAFALYTKLHSEPEEIANTSIRSTEKVEEAWGQRRGRGASRA